MVIRTETTYDQVSSAFKKGWIIGLGQKGRFPGHHLEVVGTIILTLSEFSVYRLGNKGFCWVVVMMDFLAMSSH